MYQIVGQSFAVQSQRSVALHYVVGSIGSILPGLGIALGLPAPLDTVLS